MLFNRSSDFFIQYIEEKAKKSRLNSYAYIKIIILVLLYILVPVLLSTVRLSTELSGVLAQSQIILSVIIIDGVLLVLMILNTSTIPWAIKWAMFI